MIKVNKQHIFQNKKINVLTNTSNRKEEPLLGLRIKETETNQAEADKDLYPDRKKMLSQKLMQI